MNLNDAFFLMLLTATVPLLVTHYLRAPVFSNDFRGWVILGGLLWMAYAVFSDVISGEILEVWKADGWYHAYMGGIIADYMRADKWNLVWDHMVIGNSMYQCYVGLIMYLTGTTDAFVTAPNGWFGFWGGLVLIRHFQSSLSLCQEGFSLAASHHFLPIGYLLDHDERQRSADVLVYLPGLREQRSPPRQFVFGGHSDGSCLELL